MGQGRVDNTFTYKGRDGNHAAVVRAESRAVPHLAEQHIVVELRKFGCEFSQLGTSRSLGYFFLCHNIKS